MTTTTLIRTEVCSEGFPKRSENNRIAPAAKKILVIDDQWDTPLFVALQREGYEVISCESPQKAWGLAWTFRPDFIIVHLGNPSKGDISTLQGCAVLAGGSPIIVARPILAGGAVMKALEEVAAAFLSHPLKRNALREVFDELESSLNDKWSW